MPQDLNDDKSTLVQVMAWCRQATSRFMGPYDVTRPKSLSLDPPVKQQFHKVEMGDGISRNPAAHRLLKYKIYINIMWKIVFFFQYVPL